MTATNLRALVREGATADAIAAHLDALEPAARAAQATFLGRSDQRRLFDLVEGKGVIRVDDVVPPAVGPMREVVHLGKNTLPLFTRFAKVFCRPDSGPPGELWGYNRNSALLETTVGPGYYVAYDRGADEVLVDYLRQPPRHPEGWPAIIPNSSRLSFFVYNGTQDVLRRVSKHVSIGRAMRNQKWMNAWFILIRQDP